MRTPLIAGNWKMNGAWQEAERLLEGIETLSPRNAEVLVCPPFTALAAAAGHLAGTGIRWGAQNAHPKAKGAYTGEISPEMLRELGCSYVICGHSERRSLFGESNAFIHEKVKAVFAHQMTPILCVGETAEERAAGRTEAVITGEVEAGTAGLAADEAARLVIAYEPVWAIGKGQAATAADAEEICRHIRAAVEQRFGRTAAALIRILYGGSVTSGNISEFLGAPDIDGALVGGASLDAAEFAAIAEKAERI